MLIVKQEGGKEREEVGRQKERDREGAQAQEDRRGEDRDIHFRILSVAISVSLHLPQFVVMLYTSKP